MTIEDAAELQLHQEHVARLETRPANVEGKGAIKQRQLVVNALRMRPDRIVVGEVRSEEALDMLQAMNTGHDGSLTTVHANTPRDALTRIETMIAMGATNLPEKAMRQQIASAIQIVVQQTRLADGVAQGDDDLGDHGHGRRRDHHAGHLRVREGGRHQGRQGCGPVPRHRRAAEGRRADEGRRHPSAHRHVRRRHGGAVMFAAFVVFVLVTGAVMGAYLGLMNLPGWLAARRLDRRLREVSLHGRDPLVDAPTLVTEVKKGPLPGDRQGAWRRRTRRWRS